MYTEKNHVFVICAYKESAYLEECIRSLLNQTVVSDIKIVTSTPCKYITETADKYMLPLVINQGEGGIANDWNFALKQAKAQVVTIAHQDDIYCRDYVENMLQSINCFHKPLIFFSDYGEIREGNYIVDNKLLKVKRWMLLPLRIHVLQRSIWVRRRILSFGSPISCPTVSYVMDHLTEPVFKNGYRGGADWQAWEKLSSLKGAFVYNTNVLMYHRIHENSETSAIIANSVRTDEDYEMFRLFWPEFIARRLSNAYKKGQNSNTLRGIKEDEST